MLMDSSSELSAITRLEIPGQSMGEALLARLSVANSSMVMNPNVPVTAMVQNTDRNPKLLASHPPASASRPAMPPFAHRVIARSEA